MIRNSGYWKYIKKCIFFVLPAVFFFFSAPCDALQPHEILVIANKNAARSVGLAKYYMQKRNIPQANLVVCGRLGPCMRPPGSRLGSDQANILISKYLLYKEG